MIYFGIQGMTWFIELPNHGKEATTKINCVQESCANLLSHVPQRHNSLRPTATLTKGVLFEQTQNMKMYQMHYQAKSHGMSYQKVTILAWMHCVTKKQSYMEMYNCQYGSGRNKSIVVDIHVKVKVYTREKKCIHVWLNRKCNNCEISKMWKRMTKGRIQPNLSGQSSCSIFVCIAFTHLHLILKYLCSIAKMIILFEQRKQVWFKWKTTLKHLGFS